MSLSNTAELEAFIEKYSDWKIVENAITKEYEFVNFSCALAFTVQVGIEAEKIDHHPDINLHSWNKVKITLSTHSEGGVTNKDLELADILEEL